jgi:hypothetical protein
MFLLNLSEAQLLTNTLKHIRTHNVTILTYSKFPLPKNLPNRTLRKLESFCTYIYIYIYICVSVCVCVYQMHLMQWSLPDMVTIKISSDDSGTHSFGV